MSNIDVVPGGELPNMPGGKGNSEKLMLFGIRKDTGETVLFHVSELIRALEEGEYIPALAGDLNINTGANVTHTQRVFVETTGGDTDIDSKKKAYVKSVKGTDGGIPASGAVIRSVGFNQIAPSGISGQTATFIAVTSAWGEYGKSIENNGYLFVDADNNIVTPISVKQNGVSVPTHTENGITYYLPSSNGEMVATFNTGVDVTEMCGHVCWSNYRDAEYKEYVADEISLQSVITSVGGTLNRVTNALGQSVYDEIIMSMNADDRIWWHRVGVTLAKNLTWNQEVITSESEEDTTTTYRYYATVSGMKNNGIFSLPGCAVSGFYLSDNKLMVESASITTVNDLKTALGNTNLKYELAAPTHGTHSLTGEIEVDDFGTIMLIAGSATDINMEIEFASYWRDIFKNLPANIESDGLVTAAALVALEERIAKIERGLSNGISHLVVEDLEVKRKMSAHLVDDGTNDSTIVLHRAGTPSKVPAFIGQRYINTTTGDRYTASGVSAVTDWKQD